MSKEPIICNKCSKNCIQGICQNACGLIKTKIIGKYGSDPLKDCHNYYFSLCETCCEELFKTFKIPVTIKEYCISDPDYCTSD